MMRIRLLATAAAFLAPPAATAQWVVTNLHPPGATHSYALSASGNQQGGYVVWGGVEHAGLWNGTAASWTDLHVAGSTRSNVYGVGGGQQAGWAWIGGVPLASVWSGTSQSWLNLNPPDATDSRLNATDGVHQGGWVDVEPFDPQIPGFGNLFSGPIASVWSGTAASWVNLRPPGALSSEVFALSGEYQVGYALMWSSGLQEHASLWHGSAASWVDLHPAGASRSYAYAMSNGKQAGYVSLGEPAQFHASLWSGTAASWVDLNPFGATESEVFASDGDLQVGGARVGLNYRACLWSGTTASWVDLHTFLPAGVFSVSTANGVSRDASHTYVAGYGLNTVNGRWEALLWTRTDCPTPSLSTPPESRTVCPRLSTSFTVGAAGGGPFVYGWEWRLSADPTWALVVNGVNAHGGTPQFEAAGATTGRLSLRPPAAPGGGRLWPESGYLVRAVVSNGCGPTVSDPAALVICSADFNCDGFLDFFDSDDFVVAFEAGDTSADFNEDGFLDFFDADAFVQAFEAGC